MSYLELIKALRPYKSLYYNHIKIPDLNVTLDSYEYLYHAHNGSQNILTISAKRNLQNILKYIKLLNDEQVIRK